MIPEKINIASRGSPLALVQAEWVAQKIQEKHPNIKAPISKIKTQGDKILDSPLAKIGGKGLFVKEIEEALMEGRADIAIHSLKDVPFHIPEGLILSAFPAPESSNDVLVFSKKLDRANPQNLDKNGECLSIIPKGFTVGTSSVRRAAQLRRLRSDLQICDLRGNVGTRLKKLDEMSSPMDAIILAEAGLRRLNLSHRIDYSIPIEDFFPAVGQGVLAIETRCQDFDVIAIIKELNHAPTHSRVICERAFLRRLEASCQMPVGGFAQICGKTIQFRGFLSSLDGQHFLVGEEQGPLENAEEIGIRLAENLLASGGSEILATLSES
jgi:hydroxymethylbilane synthase